MKNDEKMSTKEQILEAALELFSVRGYEATSISQIADAVGIRKASLYSHFASKQDILDKLVEDIIAEYEEHSIFGKAKTEPPASLMGENGLDVETMAAMVIGQIRYSLHDPHVSKARKMLIIEQFQNEELCRLQTKQSYTDIMGYFTALFSRLQKAGVLAEADPEIMAAQYCAPISLWMNLCDREPRREEEVMALIQKHIRQFYSLYLK